MKQLLACATLTAVLGSWASTTAAQTYSPLGCAWNGPNVDVYFNPGTIAANGFSVSEFRGEMLDAMALWNAQHQADYDFVYIADTSSQKKTGAVVVNHQDIWSCMDNNSAKAFFAGAGPPCETSKPHVRVILQDSCNPGVTRNWTTGWPPNPLQTLGLTGWVGYEFALVHELGHMLSLPDAFPPPPPALPAGVMCCVGSHGSFLHLAPIDIESVRSLAGNTTRRPHTIWSTTGATWSSPTLLSSTPTASPPDLDGNLPGGFGPIRAAFWDPLFRSTQMREGTDSSWTTMPSASPAFDVDATAAIANSQFAETMVVWLDDCDGNTLCDIEWAWTNNNGTNWTRGTIADADTHSKAYVEYDGHRDRFVIAAISHLDARIRMVSAPAVSAPGWGTWSDTVALPYRHLGGMVFDNTGNGLLVASADFVGVNGLIAQFNISSTSSGVYSLNNGQWAAATASQANTRLPFGIARDAGSGRIMMVWRDGGSPRPLATAVKFGVSTSVKFSAPSFPVLNIVNGASVAFDNANNRFVAGFSY